MLKNLGLAAVMSVMVAAPAWAEGQCGDEPIPPAIPSAADIGMKSPADAAKMRHQAFLDVKAWQQSANDYRACLDADATQAKRDLVSAQSQSKPDQDKIKRLQAQIAADDAASNKRDTEESLVNQFDALRTAYCARADVDRSACPKS
jgi:hypothetical protein